MKVRNPLPPILVLGFLGLTASPGLAFPTIASNWRDFYPDSCQLLQDATTNSENCVLCHTAGNNFNPYGQDLKDNNRDFALIQDWDSDGDGRTNAEEILVDCTFPGDSTSPTEIDTWGRIKALFR